MPLNSTITTPLVSPAFIDGFGIQSRGVLLGIHQSSRAVEVSPQMYPSAGPHLNTITRQPAALQLQPTKETPFDDNASHQ
jgi:hypothetical protein